jgi:hypothetical protein
MMSLRSRVFLAAGVAAALAGATAPAGMGGITGPCSATIAGEDVAKAQTGPTSTPITVDEGSSVPIAMTAPGSLSHVKITMEFPGFSWVVRDKEVSTPTYEDTVPVDDYATYGVGLYKVKGVGTGGDFACFGAALVRVKGNPITTVAGGAALGAAVVGLLGVLASVLGGRGGVRPFRSLVSIVLGLLLGAGALVLLQQAAVLYPTTTVGVVLLAGGAALGLVAPWVGKLLLPGRAAA